MIVWKRALLVSIALGAVGGLLIGANNAALAQQITLDMGRGGGTATARIMQLIALITVVSIAPSLLIMVTSFTRIIIVLSFVRTAMGTATTPPNQVLMSLALFLTIFIMMPVFEKAWDLGVVPLMDEEIDEFEAFDRASAPFREFMLLYTREKDLELFTDLSNTPDEEIREEIPMHVLTPAFMISELRRAFEIGFLIFIPFLVIDMVVASVLMAMGMMMLPPVIISLPFKIIFFVLVDGWYMVVGSLAKGFGGL